MVLRNVKMQKTRKIAFQGCCWKNKKHILVLFIYITSDSKLIIAVFQDLSVDKMTTWGQGEVLCIINNILLSSTEKTIKDFAEKDTFFSEGTDASSHGNIKMFSTVIHFYRHERGIIHHLLDFCEESNQTAVAIFENVRSLLKSMLWASAMHYYLQLIMLILTSGDNPFSAI